MGYLELQITHNQVQINRSIFASYGMHAMNYFASLRIFMHQGHRMQRQQNHWSYTVVYPDLLSSNLIKPRCRPIERFLYDLEMKTCEQNRNNKQTEIVIRLVYRIDTNARGFWLVKQMCKNFLRIN